MTTEYFYKHGLSQRAVFRTWQSHVPLSQDVAIQLLRPSGTRFLLFSRARRRAQISKSARFVKDATSILLAEYSPAARRALSFAQPPDTARFADAKPASAPQQEQAKRAIDEYNRGLSLLRSDPRAAFAAFLECVKLLPVFAPAWLQLAWLYLHPAFFDLERAKHCAQNGFHLAKQLGQPAYVAFGADTLGTVLAAQGQFEEALALFDEAIGILRKLKNERALVWVQLRKAATLNDLGRYSNSNSVITEILPRLRQGTDQNALAYALRQLTISLQGVKEYGRAHVSADEALRISASQGDDFGEAWAYAIKATVYADEQKFDDAEICFNNALEIYKRHDWKLAMAGIYFNTAVVHMKRSKWAEAIEYNQYALAIFEEFKDLYWATRAKENLAIAHYNRNHAGDRSIARTLLDEAKSSLILLGLNQAAAVLDAWISTIDLGGVLGSILDGLSFDFNFDFST